MSESKAKRYAGRMEYLNHLLKGDLSPKQRREAEKEFMAASVKHAIYSKPQPTNLTGNDE